MYYKRNQRFSSEVRILIIFVGTVNFYIFFNNGCKTSTALNMINNEAIFTIARDQSNQEITKKHIYLDAPLSLRAANDIPTIF